MLPRSQEKEILDVTTPPLDEFRKAMRHIAFTNRVFLNNWLIAHYTSQLIGNTGPASILDIGTGIGDIPKYLAQKLNRPARKITAVGIDINSAVLKLAAEYIGTVSGVAISEQALETIENNRFDVAVMSQMLHHLSPSEAIAMLGTAYAKVSKGIIISDFIRSRTNHYLARLTIALTGSNRVNKNDGPLSILRSYTDAEIKALLAAAGIQKYKIHNFLIRKIVVIYKK